MSISRPIFLSQHAPVCVCGKAPKAYCTDNKTCHVECFPCKISTPRLSSVHVAALEFKRMCDTVRADRNMPRQLQIVKTGG